MAALAGVHASAQINPALGIKWPAGCNAANQVYSRYTQGCITVSNAGLAGLPTTGGTMTGAIGFSGAGTASGTIINLGAVSYLSFNGAPTVACSSTVNPGALYVDPTDSFLYQCFAVSTVYTWHQLGYGASVTGQANGVIPLGCGTNSICGKSHWADNGTVMTATETLNLNGVNLNFYDSTGAYYGGSFFNLAPPSATQAQVVFCSLPAASGSVSSLLDFWCEIRANGTQNKIYLGDTGTVSKIQTGVAHDLQFAPGGGANTSAVNALVLSAADNSATFGGAIHPLAARKGTFVCTSGGTITIANANELAASDVIFTLNTAGGTISTVPAMKLPTPGTGFTVLCATSDTSTYNYTILN